MIIKQKEFLTSREAAQLLGVAVSSIQLWTNSGLLHAWATGGGHRRIARCSVEAMLRQRHVATQRSASRNDLTVLLVEDKPEERNLFQQQFAARSLKIKLLMADNGFEGLVQIGRYLPDVIITDLKMPNMDGFQMIRHLKQMPELADSLTIAISALTVSEVKARGGLPEDVKSFSKPILFDELEKLLCKYAENISQSIQTRVVTHVSI